MPATEQTWYDLKALHVMFAVTAVALLGATVWMLAADHDRPWKQYARGYRDLETWSAQARIKQQDLADYRQRGVELEESLAESRRAPLDKLLAEEFVAAVRSVPDDARSAALLEQDIQALIDLGAKADQQESADAINDRRFALRGDLLERMRDVAKRAKFRENLLAGALKLRKAGLDKNRADYELGVADDVPAERLAELLSLADAARQQVSEATLAFQTANSYRKNLESLLGRITAAEDVAAKAISDHRFKLVQLQKVYDDRRSNWGKTALEMPVLDAFNSPLRIEQVWLPDLTLSNNFREVARFDRCITCHRGMDASLPGSPQDPAYPAEETITVLLSTPAAEEAERLIAEARAGAAGRAGGYDDALQALYGLRLADRGLFDAEAPTVNVVLPAAATEYDDAPEPAASAASAGLLPGDVIVEVAGRRTMARSVAFDSLLETPRWGSPL